MNRTKKKFPFLNYLDNQTEAKKFKQRKYLTLLKRAMDSNSIEFQYRNLSFKGLRLILQTKPHN